MKNSLNLEFEKFIKEVEKQSFFKKVFIRFAMFLNRDGLYDKWFNHRLFIEATDFNQIIDSIGIASIAEEYGNDEQGEDEEDEHPESD